MNFLACFCDCRISIISDKIWIFNCFTQYLVFFRLLREVLRGVKTLAITIVSLIFRQ